MISVFKDELKSRDFYVSNINQFLSNMNTDILKHLLYNQYAMNPYFLNYQLFYIVALMFVFISC